MSSGSDSGVLRSMVLLSCVSTLLNTPEDELKRIQRIDFTNDSQICYEEIINQVDISLVFKVLLESSDDIKQMSMQEFRDVPVKLYQYKLKPINIGDRESLIGAAGYVIGSNIQDVKDYVSAF
eukprot:gnl/Chilomastix_caulleri/2093.p1 GENE.gnl/Chilomastix_caulleri/2093~~gnl/Chilomastix_caulleri/2093.p1  ORF type:complete len:123 (-),score=23.13 gnl/Chilomastix_caulleri/2093:80-448(-)